MHSQALIDTFCRPFETEASILALIATLNGYIANSSSLNAEDKAYIDLDEDGVITQVDRDLWVTYMMRAYHGDHARCPFGDQTPTNYTESDPLGLATSPPTGTQIIIVDPLNPNAVKVRRGTNDCTDQADVLLEPPSARPLFDGGGTGNNYQAANKLWFDLGNLDETDWATVTFPAGTIRRFPTNANQTVLIYVRAGTQTLSKEINVRRNNGNWERPRIRIMAYPGDPQRPRIHCGASLISGGDPGPPHAASIGGYRHLWFFLFQRACALWWSGITLIGYRGDPPNRIFNDKLFWMSEEDAFGPTGDPRFFDAEFLDCRGIPSDYTGADPALYPDWIDSQYHNRFNHVTGDPVNPYNSEGSVDDDATCALRVVVDGTVINRCHIRQRAAEGPPFLDEFDDGDGLGTSTGTQNVVAKRCLFDGRNAHVACNLSGPNSIAEYCDITNPDHTGVGAFTIRYNRIHGITTRLGETDAPGYGVQLGSPVSNPLEHARLYGNVFYDITQIYYPTAGVWITGSTSTFAIDDVEITRNVFYRAGVRVGYDGGAHGTSNNVRNISIHHNAIHGLPAANDGDPVYDAPIMMNLHNFPTNMHGVTINDNLVTRQDVDPAALVEWVAGVGATDYTLAQVNGFVGCSGNYAADPKFVDPDHGNFTLGVGSPLAGVFEDEVPLAGLPAWDEIPRIPYQAALVQSGTGTAGIRLGSTANRLTELLGDAARLQLIHGCRVMADPNNTGTVWVGTRSNLTGTGGAVTDGWPLLPGESLHLNVRSTSEIYLLSTPANEAVAIQLD